MRHLMPIMSRDLGVYFLLSKCISSVFLCVFVFLSVTDNLLMFFSTLPPKKSRGKPALSKVPFLESVNGDSDYTGPGKMTSNCWHQPTGYMCKYPFKCILVIITVSVVLLLSGYAVYRKRCRTWASGPRVGQVQGISFLPCSGETGSSAAF